MSAKKATQPKASKSSTSGRSRGFTVEERAAMKEHGKELQKEARRGSRATKADGENDVLEKISEMPDADRVMAERIHAIVKDAAPSLTPRTWYGMPAYAADGKVVCFFQGASKFKERYATFGFNAAAQLDDGNMWPTAFALTKLGPDEEARIAELVEQAVS